MDLFFLLTAAASFGWGLWLRRRLSRGASLLWFWFLLAAVLTAGAFLPTTLQLLLFTALALFLLLFGAFALAVRAAARRAVTPQGSVLIVLGVRQDRTVPSAFLLRRVQLARTLWETGSFERLILSGGCPHGQAVAESVLLQEALGEAAREAILETRSRTTRENLLFSLPLAEGRDAVIVTEDYHLFRVAALLRRVPHQGRVTLVGAPAKGPLMLHFYLREFATTLVELLRGNIQFGRQL